MNFKKPLVAAMGKYMMGPSPDYRLVGPETFIETWVDNEAIMFFQLNEGIRDHYEQDSCEEVITNASNFAYNSKPNCTEKT